MFSGFTFLFIDDDDDAFLFLPNNKPMILACVVSRAVRAGVLSLSLLFVSHSSKRGRGFARFLFCLGFYFVTLNKYFSKEKKRSRRLVSLVIADKERSA